MRQQSFRGGVTGIRHLQKIRDLPRSLALKGRKLGRNEPRHERVDTLRHLRNSQEIPCRPPGLERSDRAIVNLGRLRFPNNQEASEFRRLPPTLRGLSKKKCRGLLLLVDNDDKRLDVPVTPASPSNETAGLIRRPLKESGTLSSKLAATLCRQPVLCATATGARASRNRPTAAVFRSQLGTKYTSQH